MTCRSNTPLRVRLACARWLTAAAVTLACALGLSLSAATAASPGCDAATAAATRLPRSLIRTAVGCLINAERARYGLRPLRSSDRLNQAAQQWVNTLVATGAFDHGNFAGRMHAAGVQFAVAGENLGTGQATPTQIVAAWMASPDHCRNILAPVYTQFGVGVNSHGIRHYATGPSSWAEDFDRPAGRHVPSGNWGPANRCPY